MGRRALVCGGLALAFAGCRASVVELRRPVKGPVAEVGWIDPGGGHLRWPMRGGGVLTRLRRSNALKRARIHCETAPMQVVREWGQEDIETAYAGEDLSESMRYGLDHYKVEAYRHLEFKCIR